MGIAAVIFDFNGVLVDDESVHFALFQEVLAQEGVAITERDYHERYLGYDDRGCFEAALKDAGQQADRARLDDLIARKARRYVEVAEQGLRFFPAAAETLQAVASRWPVAINSGALRPEIEYALRRMGCLDRVAAIVSAEDTDKCKPDPEGYRLALEALRAREASRSQRRHGPGLSAVRLPGDRGQPGRDRLGQGGRDVGRRREHDLRRRPAPRGRGRRRRRGAGGLHPRVDRAVGFRPCSHVVMVMLNARCVPLARPCVLDGPSSDAAQPESAPGLDQRRPGRTGRSAWPW